MPIFFDRLRKNDTPQTSELEEYRLRLDYIQNRLEKVRQLFDMECDPEKIESLIYEEKALMIRLNHLIKTAKSTNLNVPDENMRFAPK